MPCSRPRRRPGSRACTPASRHALESLPEASVAPAERAFDLAHHWLAAGPVHAPQAWRAAAAAAAEARRDFANVEAADLYRQALDAHALDPAGTRDERYDLLLSFAEAAAWAAKWRPVVEATAEAVALASADGDPERVARAAAALTRYWVWTPAGVRRGRRGRHRRPALGAARPRPPRLAGALRADARPGRAALLPARVRAGGARRSSTRAPRPPAASATPRCGPGRPAPGGSALWRSAHLDRRLALAVEELAASRESGNEAAEALAHTALAATGLEEGDLETWESEAAAADDDRPPSTADLRRVRAALRAVQPCAAGRRRARRPTSTPTPCAPCARAWPPRPWSGTSSGCSTPRPPGGPGRPSRSRAACSSTTGPGRDDFGRTPLLHVLALAGMEDELRADLARRPVTAAARRLVRHQ